MQSSKAAQHVHVDRYVRLSVGVCGASSSAGIYDAFVCWRE